MNLKCWKLFILGLFILLKADLGFSQSCLELINSPFEQRVQLLLQKRFDHRKALEDALHRSIGTLDQSLESQLNQIFRIYNRTPRLSKAKQLEITRAINRDPIASRLSNPSRAKLIRLVFRGYARPYMAFLIARYMEERENRLGLLTYDVMSKIEDTVLSYSIEWTVRTLMQNRLSDINEREKLEIISALKTPWLFEDPRGLTYNSSNYTVGHESLFIGYLIERRAWIASVNMLNLDGSIFE
jgi:hypothetical protein